MGVVRPPPWPNSHLLVFFKEKKEKKKKWVAEPQGRPATPNGVVRPPPFFFFFKQATPRSAGLGVAHSFFVFFLFLDLIFKIN
jgi:hypothetical protein